MDIKSLVEEVIISVLEDNIDVEEITKEIIFEKIGRCDIENEGRRAVEEFVSDTVDEELNSIEDIISEWVWNQF